jgi:hypothetical protein
MPAGARCWSPVQAALALDAGDLQRSAAVLREFGNLSSPFVLFVLENAARGKCARGLVVVGVLRRGLQLSRRFPESGLNHASLRCTGTPRQRCRRMIRRPSVRARICAAEFCHGPRGFSDARVSNRPPEANPLSSRPLRLVELGAGDGSLLLRVARRWSGLGVTAEVTLLDRQNLVSTETRRAFAALNWSVESVAADVFAWLNSPRRSGGRDARESIPPPFS